MRTFLAAGLLVFVAACSESGPPTSPSTPAIVAIELIGPPTIAPGQSVQLTVIATMTDGTKTPVTENTPVTWSTTGGLLQVSPGGLMTASQTRGEGRVTARVSSGSGSGSRQSSRQFFILPDGTFRLAGAVRDADVPTFSLPNVQVEVAGAGLATMTGSEGEYLLYGVPANAVVNFSKAGYTTVSQPLQLTTHGTRDVQLALSDSRLILKGEYTLTLDMPAGCTGNLSPELRRRTYDATVTQSGARVDVLLTEPRFRLNHVNRGNRFGGYADSGSITFTLDSFNDYYYSPQEPLAYPSVAERISDSLILVPSGRSIVVRVGAGFSGGFNASFNAFGPQFPASFLGPETHCRSGATQLTLMPR